MTLSSNTVIKVLLTVLDHVFIGIRAFGVFVALTSPVFESIVQAYDILSSSFDGGVLEESATDFFVFMFSWWDSPRIPPHRLELPFHLQPILPHRVV